MASIILSSAGGAIGSSVGGTFGAIVGRAIGGFIGGGIDSALSPRHRYKVEGARLHDLTVQTATYGRSISTVFGQCRLSGNIIWALPIKAIANVTENQENKNSPVVHTTNYSYYANLAIAICGGPIDSVINIWADAKNITHEIERFRIYKGTEEQLPDSLIESYMGVGSTPAYRGTAYIVIEDFNLADYGNRIPNLSFEVKRKPKFVSPQTELSVEEELTAICIIPGSGEFVYDTQAQYKQYDKRGKFKPINVNNIYNKPDSIVSLDQLQETCPNIKWVAPVACWFGTSLDAGECKIFPGVEFKTVVSTSPDSWKVGNKERYQAHQITLKDNRPIYGGTVSDASIIRYLAELKSRGYKVMFYPMIFLDLLNKPWRGHITGNAKTVKEFFEKPNGYNEFILHYAKLAKNYADAFVIGSELKSLTSVRDESNAFPAVDCLVDLAKQVKQIFGEKVVVTYAADWSEYHHSMEGWYNLDKLWGCDAIDVVGIDAYFPITDNLSCELTSDMVKAGWCAGEGYDYYYASGDHTKKIPLSKQYAWKDIKWWWENHHTNPNGERTEWVPKSKKIWFTEFGFSSIDRATNQPNVFYDLESFDGGVPLYSSGMTDFKAQRIAIDASLKYWRNSEMVENLFLWTWDARPYPSWPNLKDVWADGDKWLKGHWVNGKFGLTLLADVIKELCTKAGVMPEQIDVSEISDFLDGYVLGSRESVWDAIEDLSRVYFFDVVESEGKVRFIPRKQNKALQIAQDDMIYRGNQLVNISRTQEQALPKHVEITYLDRSRNYAQNVSRSMSMSSVSNRNISLDVPIVLDKKMAEYCSNKSLKIAWLERNKYQFCVPFKYVYIEPGDSIVLNSEKLRVVSVTFTRNRILEVEASSSSDSVGECIYEPEMDIKPHCAAVQEYWVHLIDIPEKMGASKLSPTIYAASANLRGAFKRAHVYYNAYDEVEEYKYLTTINMEATIGVVHQQLPDASSDVFDLENRIIVSLISGSLISVDYDRLMNGANMAIVGEEVIQFKTARLLEHGKYVISELLRGRVGTEHLTNSHNINDRFVLLDNAIASIEMPLNMIGTKCRYKLVAEGQNLSGATSHEFIWQANCLKPLSVVHLSQKMLDENTLQLSWVRRSRINGGWNNNIEVPLDEPEEKYEVNLWRDEKLVDSFIVNQQSVVIDLSKYVSRPKIEVAQLSAIIGRGIVSCL